MQSSVEPVRVFEGCRTAVLGVAVFSALVNILTLTGAFYMMQVYDRVIPSRSIATLVGLSILAALLFAMHGVLDFVRGRILLRIGRSVDERLGARVFGLIATLPLVRRTSGDGLQPMRDLDHIRAFLAGAGPPAFFDLPWVPFYLAICFLFHPLIGLVTLCGALVLAVATLLTETLTQSAVKAAAIHGVARNGLAEASRRNAEVLAAMGMTGRMSALWCQDNDKHLAAHERASDVAGAFSGFSKVFRLALQSAVLGIAAYLAILGEATAGIIIASSIVSARALAPVDTAIANWKGFVSARQSWTRLRDLLVANPPRDNVMQLRKPERSLVVEVLGVAPPGDPRHVVRNVSFRVRGGSAVGVIGPTASGKSSLARALVGVWPIARGNIRLDAAALSHWTSERLGRHVGYLPQDIELFDGTVAQNIARFDPDAASEAIIAAAETAGVHEMILRLPKGYDTRIGEAGMALSAGQRQRVALARALYGDPFLVVLDEPNSNLDADGEQALTNAIAGVRKRNGIVVVIAHRPSALAAVDLVLVMNDGEMQAFGPQEEVLRKVLRPVPASPVPVSAAPMAAGAG
jgi:ATP-binding cassette subfamily C protein